MAHIWLTVENVVEPIRQSIAERLGVDVSALDPNREPILIDPEKNAYSVFVADTAHPDLGADGVNGPWSDAQFGSFDPSK